MTRELKTQIKDFASSAVLVTVILAAAVMLHGCAPKQRDGSPGTGKVIPQFGLWAPLGGPRSLMATSYAEVDRDWLLKGYAEWRAELHRAGVVQWDPRFNCSHFSTHFVAWCQLKHYLASFHASTNPGASLAIGVFAYKPEANPQQGHALVEVVTQNGREFFEPQTGKFVTLSAQEIKSSWISLM